MKLRTCLTMLAALIVSWPAHAQQGDRYLLLATSRTSTMLKEINDAVEKGYRVVAASRTEGSEVIVVLERSTEAYHYRLLATTRTETLEKELNEAAEAGYRAIPRAVGTKRTLGDVMKRNDTKQRGTNSEGELLVLMEKGPDTPQGLKYKVLATSRTGTLQKEMSDLAERGYELIGLISRSEHIAIFERAE